MPVIDIHTHCRRDRSFLPDRWFENLYTRLASQGNVDRCTFEREHIARWEDPNGDKLIAMMDAAGVDIAVTFPTDYAYVLGEARSSIETINAWYPTLAKKHPDRVVTFAAIDPRRPNAADLFRQAITEWGAKGIKLYPPTGFLPNDPVCHPIYRLASDFGAVVLFHTGPLPAPMKSRYAHPFYIDDVAADFPELKIIVGHTGGQYWWKDAIAVMRMKPNLFADLAGWQMRTHNLEQFIKDLGEVRDTIGVDRILYGSDWPGSTFDQAQWINTIRKLPESSVKYGVKFSKEEVDAILGGNAGRLLGI